jgi:hypothetical protein
MEVEGEISFTFEAADISVNWVDGLSVYETGLYRHIDPGVNALLIEAVRVIYHAKHGRVPVTESWNIEFKEINDLDIEGDDVGVAKAFTPDGKVLVPMTPNYRYVRVEDLTSEDVDDALLNYLECYSMDGPYAMGQFVIEDTPEAQIAVEATGRAISSDAANPAPDRARDTPPLCPWALQGILAAMRAPPLE